MGGWEGGGLQIPFQDLNVTIWSEGGGGGGLKNTFTITRFKRNNYEMLE